MADAPMGSTLSLAPPLIMVGAVVVRMAAPSTNAAIRTTTAPTIISGGAKDNVLPIGASAIVNFRLLPGDSLAAVLRQVRATVADSLVRVRPLAPGQEASPVSRTDNAAFSTLHRTIKSVFPQVLVAPYTVLGATDARTYAFLCPPATYRFSPLLMDQKAIDSMHGTNERVRSADYQKVIRFYAALIRNAQ
ncbi:MAG: M20/M25/M40 family metallo-hydrolase [Hymenobacter sp.]|nr:MAG: M20/M25/M40 family metallo-hydrolase [Hymenobacter sp.]